MSFPGAIEDRKRQNVKIEQLIEQEVIEPIETETPAIFENTPIKRYTDMHLKQERLADQIGRTTQDEYTERTTGPFQRRGRKQKETNKK